MKSIKVLVLEDDTFKYFRIKRSLEEFCFPSVSWAENVEDGLKMVEAALQEGGSFDLCITDMNYPLQGKKESNPKAGMIFIQRLQEMGVDTPVVLCSSIRYETERAFACIWYSEARNLSSDLREVVARL